MAANIKEIFAQAIASGLGRRSMTTCSRWAQKCRIMGGKSFPGPWTFKYHPWLKEMHDENGDWVGQKGAQVGYTETVLDRTFFKIDVERVDCLYVLPAKTPDASDFSSGRFDSALEESPYLRNLFSDVRNIGHKRAGATNLYIRGSRSKSGLKSVPVGLLVLDEVEEMTQENIPLAFERQSGQREKQSIAISTPRVPGRGINLLFQETSQEHFFFRCPHCNKWTELIFPESMVITAEALTDPRIKDTHLICKECKSILSEETKTDWLAEGKWEPSVTGREKRGFHINQLYSSTVSPSDIAASFFKAQLNPADEQEFYNSKLGLTHTVSGARLNEEEIRACITDYKKNEQIPVSGIVTMGVDQGRWIHYEIDYWIIPQYTDGDFILSCKPRVLDEGKVLNFTDLDGFIRKWGISHTVIDAQPERRLANAFASRFPGFVHLCFYSRGIAGKSLHEGTDLNEPTVSVDRTYWMDTALSRFRTRNILLPLNVSLEYINHMQAPMRVYEKDENGNTIGKYVKAEADQDHLAHARTYSEIAFSFAMSIGQSQNMRSPR